MSCQIVLMTDFGDSPYQGVMKGVVKRICPSADIIDLYHGISPQSVAEAAYVLAGCAGYFSERSVFVCVVDPGVGSQRKIIIAETGNHIYIAPDNGLLSLVLKKEKIRRIVEASNPAYRLPELSGTFHGRDIFAPAAAHIAAGADIIDFGEVVNDVEEISLYEPVYSPTTSRGHIIFIDRFGNLVTNIESSRFESGEGLSTILAGKRISGLYGNYSEVQEGQPVVLKGSFGYIEIGVRNSDACRYFGASVGDNVTIETDAQ